MPKKILILVLGNYTNVSQYLEGIPLAHESNLNNLTHQSYDLYNLMYIFNRPYSILSRGSDISNTQEFYPNHASFTQGLQNFLETNPFRMPSADDIFGLYDSSDMLAIFSTELTEDISVTIYYNYLYCTQSVGNKPDNLIIVDNSDTKFSTTNRIEFLLDKFRCDTVVYTYRDKSELQALIRKDSSFNEFKLTINNMEF